MNEALERTRARINSNRDVQAGRRTDGVVFQHTHRLGRPGARVLVEEARHGHGEEAHRDHAGLGWRRGLVSLRERGIRRGGGGDWRRAVPFFAMLGGLASG